MNKKIALLALLVVLGLVNWSILGKENHIAHGRVVYMELAPVDPRSLMQGDYMALNFRIAEHVYNALPKSDNARRWNRDVAAEDGYVVVSVDDRHIATFQRLHNDIPLADNEITLQYRVRHGEVKFATNAFFFQEGHAQAFEAARYGQFRVNEHGAVLLTAMYDEKLALIKGEPALTIHP